jgi:hypothetical protein
LKQYEKENGNIENFEWCLEDDGYIYTSIHYDDTGEIPEQSGYYREIYSDINNICDVGTLPVENKR